MSNESDRMYMGAYMFLLTLPPLPNLVQLIAHSMNRECRHLLVGFRLLGVIFGFGCRDLAVRSFGSAFDHAQLVTDAETSLRAHSDKCQLKRYGALIHHIASSIFNLRYITGASTCHRNHQLENGHAGS